jgi:type IV secretory pathway VirJ component
MHPQANSQNIAPEAPNRPAPQERGLDQQADQLRTQSPERQVAPAVERGAHQPTGQAVASSLQAPQAAVSPLNVAPAMQQVAAVPTLAPVVASSDKIEKPWIDRADEIMHTKAQDPYAEEEAHEELSAQYLKQRFNIDIKRSDPQH